MLIALSILIFSYPLSAKVYLNQNEFVSLLDSSLDINTNHQEWDNKTLWLEKDIQKQIKGILYHKYPKLRLRYKIKNNIDTPNKSTTIWFLEEIGKERPISFGVAIKNSQIKLIKVLEFRESRGYEISIPEFSQQFDNIGLNNAGNLDANINGITGATMSVRAMKKISRLAILLHKIVINKTVSLET